VAYIDPDSQGEVERECIEGRFDIAETYPVDTVGDHRSIPGLEIKPPNVTRYFCRVKPESLARFAEENGLRHLPARQVEDEYVYQNTFRLNQRYYTSLGDKRAFVLCHGRDLMVYKIVGYAEQAIAYYRLEDLSAYIWISHQRYPTKGRIWHPAGAHPFIGVNEALVHNGDFANYHRVTEYLRQRNIVPLFLTDTEVSVLLFDLWDRVYAYPLEVLLEAMAPTTERDFDMLPPEKQTLYQAIQQTHLHGSPDGPWFFIIARSRPDFQFWQLLGITDTSMLRPQVFALYESNGHKKGTSPVQIGLIASERQAINACLRSLSQEDPRFESLADKYWVARGGSYTDGGAFVITVSRNEADNHVQLAFRDKFGKRIEIPRRSLQEEFSSPNLDYTKHVKREITIALHQTIDQSFSQGQEDKLQILPESLMDAYRHRAKPWFDQAQEWITLAEQSQFNSWMDWLLRFSAPDDARRSFTIAVLTILRDLHYPTGLKKRSALLASVNATLYRLLRGIPGLVAGSTSLYRLVDLLSSRTIRPPQPGEQVLVVDARDFPSEGEQSAARLLCQAHALGWRTFIAFDWRGGRFAGCGLGADTSEVRIDLYGDCGDYLGSGLDGAQVYLHGDAQDQVGQILKRGRLVIYGDVGQTFLYGAKGGEIFVMGSAAGRPLINAVGRPRAVINGTCLDYLAESFMAGDPLNGGGFAIINGVTFNEAGKLVELDTPYPGGNLFSLASGGAIYLRDPHRKLDEDQLNGGQFATLSLADWHLIEPYLLENQALFGVRMEDLLRANGELLPPEMVYRKVEVKSLDVLH
jgi:hypothetical protein